MKISDLINHLNKIIDSDGDLEIYNDRYSTRVRIMNETSFNIAFLQEPTNKREVLKFWHYDETKKSKKVLRVY